MIRRTARHAMVVVALLASFTPALAQAPPFATMWGSQGSGLSQFNFAHHLALSPTGDVYVGDLLNDRVQQFTSGGAYIRQWPVTGADGVAVGPDSAVFVVGVNQVRKFSASGALLLSFGTPGVGLGQLENPIDVAVDVDGNIYVAEMGNHRVQKFDPTGASMGWFGSEGSGDGEFEFPFGVTVGPDGYVYVADVQTHRIQKFTADGDFVLGWGTFGSGPGQLNGPGRPCVLVDGTLIVPDQGNSRMQVFANDGTFVQEWGSPGTGPGQFNHPTCAACNGTGSIVYVMDKDNARVQKFGGVSTGVESATWGAIKKRYR
jgi:DNA-binding beta-propeller fold protein YncE